MFNFLFRRTLMIVRDMFWLPLWEMSHLHDHFALIVLTEHETDLCCIILRRDGQDICSSVSNFGSSISSHTSLRRLPWPHQLFSTPAKPSAAKFSSKRQPGDRKESMVWCIHCLYIIPVTLLSHLWLHSPVNHSWPVPNCQPIPSLNSTDRTASAGLNLFY